MENALVRWKETYDRSIELADVSFTLLSTLLDYCKSNNIPLYREQGVWNLVSKAQSIIREIENLTSIEFPKLADEKKQHPRTDDKGTEPPRRFCEVFVW